MNFENLVGLKLKSIAFVRDGDEGDILRFEEHSGRVFELYHAQDCCENVCIEDISGDLNDLIGPPILVAEQRESEDEGILESLQYSDEKKLWTFYTLRTIKGTVDIRWFGSSNGHYSVAVSFREVTPEQRRIT